MLYLLSFLAVFWILLDDKKHGNGGQGGIRTRDT
jgi:hypothetical protein